MASKVKMEEAFHPEVGRVIADDVFFDKTLKTGLECVQCKVPVSFVEQYIRTESQTLVPSHFRLKKGHSTHWDVEGGMCKYNKENSDTVSVSKSKIIGTKIEKEMVCRINIPVTLDKKIKELLEADYIYKDTISSKNEKKSSPGTYIKKDKELSDYINSARGIAKLANEFLPDNERTLQLVTFKFFGVTASWNDLYYENWDLVFNKFASEKPKHLICLRGIYKSQSKPFIEEGEEWVSIRLNKISISKKKFSETFGNIKLYKPMFQTLLESLQEYEAKNVPVEITFFGNIERFLYEGKQNITGIAYTRKQVHIQPLKTK